jgi:hypothetical protein
MAGKREKKCFVLLSSLLLFSNCATAVCPPTLQSYQSFPESAAYDEHKVIDAEGGTYSGK